MGPSPKFVADAMLGSLARKLRILGFDTLYFTEGRDTELEALARKEGRIILTSDKGLFGLSQRRGSEAVLVSGVTDLARLRSVIAQTGLGIGPRKTWASRCAVCNGELEAIQKSEAAAAGVHKKVLAKHRLFFRCRSCSRVYWRGGHWERLGRLSRSLHTKDLT